MNYEADRRMDKPALAGPREPLPSPKRARSVDKNWSCLNPIGVVQIPNIISEPYEYMVGSDRRLYFDRVILLSHKICTLATFEIVHWQ